MKKIISQIRNTVNPSKVVVKEKERISNLAIDLVEKQGKKYPEIIESTLGGSFAKGTWLTGNADIDIFIKLIYTIY